MTFLCYAALLRSLPREIQKKVDVSDIQSPNIPFKINVVQNCKKFAKDAYCVFVRRLSINHKRSNERLKLKWQNDIGSFIEGSMTNVYVSTLSTALIYGHFRIINRIYATNKFLHNINVSNTNACTFCKQSTETIVHLFWECSQVQIFIKEVLSHLKLKYNININVTKITWFFLENLCHIDVVIITLIKTHIHRSRLDETKPSFIKMMQLIKEEARKESNIAKTNNKLDQFETKWGSLKNILNITSTSEPNHQTAPSLVRQGQST